MAGGYAVAELFLDLCEVAPFRQAMRDAGGQIVGGA